MRDLSAKVVAAGLCLIGMAVGVSMALESSVYWRADLHQGTSIIAYGQGATEDAALQDCQRLQAITRAMTAAETRKAAVAAVTTSAVRWCNNVRRYSTVAPDPVAQPVNCVVSAWGAWSDPEWLDCNGGMQTRALVRTRTIVTQPANGGTACPALVEASTQTRVCSGTATLSWTPPTHYTNGNPLTDLRNYRIVYGTSANSLTRNVETVAGAPPTYTVTGLEPGTWHFAVIAVAASGQESINSIVAAKIVQ